jgi:hypothetical protein
VAGAKKGVSHMFPNKLQIILARLEIKEDATRKLRNRVKLFPENRLDAEKFILELEEERKIANCSICSGEPFCKLFVACAYNALERDDLVRTFIGDAIECFRKHGSDWNEALSTWLLGAFNTTTYPILASHDLTRSIKLFEKISVDLESKGEYNQLYICRQLIDNIKNDI